MRRGAQVALTACGLVLALGCGRRPAYVVSVRATAGPYGEQLSAVGLGRSTLEDAARQGLAAAGLRMGTGRRSYRARVEVVAFRAGRARPSGEPSAEVVLDLELEPVGQEPEAGALAETGYGVQPAPGGLDARAWQDALASAVRQASAGLALALSEEAKPTRRLVSDLDSPDPRIREQAMRVLADRRAREAVESLVRHLRDPERELRERAAGALAQIRDPRAVAPLIEHSREAEDGVEAARYARIIGDIGGEEARGYLETLDAGDPDPRVRAAAQEALADMAAREREDKALADDSHPATPGSVSGRMTR
ncbi:MAG TPA: HEAT repeat domain-containing protein [Anaeromyxobacter sp.]|nr:HEAT repeat domain-containing protein [Anaeromyxobacter sp.]